MINKAVGFYLLGKKGYEVLISFVRQKGADAVCYVVASEDKAIEHDFYEEIKSFCIRNKIAFIDRKDSDVEICLLGIYRFCVGWRWIIENPNNLIVFHDSPLPRYRGFAPLVNMLINAEPVVGVTALLASEEYDKGDIISKGVLNISYPIKIQEAIDRIIPVYQELVIHVYGLIVSGRLVTYKQKEDEATYSLWRNEEDYVIDWSSSAEWISRFCDSVSFPYKGAKTYLNGIAIRVLEAKPVVDVKIEDRARQFGKVIFMSDGQPVVVCGTGLLKIISMKSDDGVECVNKIPFRSRFKDNYDRV